MRITRRNSVSDMGMALIGFDDPFAATGELLYGIACAVLSQLEWKSMKVSCWGPYERYVE